MKQRQVANESWERPKWEIADAAAIQALFRGDATADQQKRAMHYIMTEVTATKYEAFHPTNERLHCYASGKQAVGHIIAMLNSLNISQLIQAKKT